VDPSQLYSAFSGVSGKELQNDPLMLMRGSQLAMAQNGQRLRLMDGWLVTQDKQGNYWYLMHGELAVPRLICSRRIGWSPR
jgi:predicted exporter